MPDHYSHFKMKMTKAYAINNHVCWDSNRIMFHKSTIWIIIDLKFLDSFLMLCHTV